MYDFMFDWLRTATKEQRHCQEMESFAKKHPFIFIKFHRYCHSIVHSQVDSKDYLKSKEKLTNLFNDNKEQFQSVFDAVKRMK